VGGAGAGALSELAGELGWGVADHAREGGGEGAGHTGLMDDLGNHDHRAVFNELANGHRALRVRQRQVRGGVPERACGQVLQNALPGILFFRQLSFDSLK
jgi:hypothetical protein